MTSFVNPRAMIRFFLSPAYLSHSRRWPIDRLFIVSSSLLSAPCFKLPAFSSLFPAPCSLPPPAFSKVPNRTDLHGLVAKRTGLPQLLSHVATEKTTPQSKIHTTHRHSHVCSLDSHGCWEKATAVGWMICTRMICMIVTIRMI